MQRGIYAERNWVFAANSNFLIHLQPEDENLWYFKLRLFDLTEFIVWNSKGLYDIGLQKYRDGKIWVCGKNSFPLLKAIQSLPQILKF